MSDTTKEDYKVLRPIQNNIDPTMELWRYIRLSAVFSLLENKQTYVPSLAELKQGDPLEAMIMSPQTRDSIDILAAEDECAKWLSRKIESEEKDLPRQLRSPKSTIWLRELAKRRAVWCWHHGGIESMAMWHIYGKEGVAIQTTPKRIDECLSKASGGILPASIGIIDYSEDRSEDQTAGEVRFRRPYFAKFAGYAHEKEVRVVFPTANDGRGILLEIDGSQLIERIMISPMIPESEAWAAMKVIKRSLPKQTHIEVKVSSSGSAWSEEHQDSRERKSTRTQQPVFRHDDPQCLMGDIPGWNVRA